MVKLINNNNNNNNNNLRVILQYVSGPKCTFLEDSKEPQESTLFYALTPPLRHG